MNPSEAQSDSASEKTYFDPEAPDSSEELGEDWSRDSSEEQFSASLGSGTASGRPEFLVDSEAAPQNHSEPEIEFEERQAQPEGKNFEESAADSHVSEQTESDWRDLVSAKVRKYKSRKPTKERYPSLRLEFDPVVPLKPDPSPKADIEDVVSPAPRQQFSEPSPLPRASFQVSTEATARVLEFPRPGTLPFNREELSDLVAEPVNDRPRIMEAPELLPPPPALGGILMEPGPEPEPERQPGLDMPLQTASIARRILAAALDGFFVAHALAIFGYMFLRFNPTLPPIRETFEIAAVLTAILWFGYQFAFLTFSGTTPGILAARLKICHFDGTPALRKFRRGRVFASVLSGASLGLGYAWCFFDEDQLSWHDRITKTHLSPRT